MSGRFALFACAAVFIGPSANAAAQNSHLAIVNVSIIPMHDDVVLSRQTVLIEGDRIAAIGADVTLPPGTTVIDGSGRYVTPGLVDAHVHLEGGPFWRGLRADFGDAPLYLSYGVTSVVNLRGTPEFFDWRRRVREGELPGPTIYTAGDFIIGPGGPTIRGPSGEVLVAPNVQTSDDVERAVAAQASLGVDAIKYYGGLSAVDYRVFADAARRFGIPLVGHSPDHLGVEEWLAARQSLAHVHQLTNLYFFPPGALFVHIRILLVTALSLLILLTVGGATAVAMAAAAVRRRRQLRRSVTRTAVSIAALGAVILVALALFASSMQTVVERVAFTAGGVVVAAATLVLTVGTWIEWGQFRPAQKAWFAAASVSGIAFTYALAAFWIPIAWRGTDRDISQLAGRIRAAGIPIQTTLVVWSEESARSALASPALAYVAPAIRERWRSMGVAGYPPPGFLAFQQKVTGALHRAGVRIVAGTDALGAPFVVPGLSLHQELGLLVESGLPPFAALRAATANAAEFLHQAEEFGTVEVGKRADLLLLEGNPLDDIVHLAAMSGVIVRGRWLSRQHLSTMLDALD